jgi:NAD(P)-dependent dehydrogenase (short-subunit alcohol dehydrogenase family)
MTISSEEGGKVKPGGKIVLTSSGGGIFPIPALPQYSATKHALIGLVRALAAAGSASKANIRINAVCPAIVDTGGLPSGLVEKLPSAQLTPMSTIIRCFDAVANLGDFTDENWVEQGRMGETVEGNVQELIWHHVPARPKVEGGQLDRQKGFLVVAEAFSHRKRQIIAAAKEED